MTIPAGTYRSVTEIFMLEQRHKCSADPFACYEATSCATNLPLRERGTGLKTT
eukprot:m.880210 g.880210  ORF g.880210 m.880210 type:complete len:53 (-) comp23590_c0_seq10:2744-2902(-)